MKKNKTMRIASVLLIAVLLTTSVISGTFAKYVTRGEIGDSARVAKFGVTISGSGTLFDQNYFREGDGNTPAGTATDTDGVVLTIESSDGSKLVAPGSKNNTGMSLTVNGAPEVDVKVTLKIEDGSKDVWLGQGVYPNRTTAALGDSFENGILYQPIVYTLWLDGSVLKTGNLNEIAAFLTTYELYVDANTNMTGVNYTYTLTWAWDFDNNGLGTTDRQDTLLGDIAAFRTGASCNFANVGETAENVVNELIEGTHYNIDTAVAISLTVTQVD